jgi:hypothetical protein
MRVVPESSTPILPLCDRMTGSREEPLPAAPPAVQREISGHSRKCSPREVLYDWSQNGSTRPVQPIGDDVDLFHRSPIAVAAITQ